MASLHNDHMSAELDENSAADPAYAYKPSLMGAMCQFVLRPDGLDWEIGRRAGRLRYDRIQAVRLSYRPVTMQSHRFITEIWSDGNPKIQIASVSWRSMVEQERLDKAYGAFVTELHRRLLPTSARTQFSIGLPAVTYWLGLAIFGAVIVATIVMVVRALGLAQWSAAAIVGAFLAIFAYQLGQYFYRNRPGRYVSTAIPAAVLPKP